MVRLENKTVLLLAYSRSGATLFNKCLAVMPNVIMLSEVNSMGGGWGVLKEKSYTTVKSQAENWYGIPIENEEFDKALLEFIDKVLLSGRIPVIRDWCHVNFNASKHNGFDPPYKLLTYELLGRVKGLKTILLVRNSIDVFISSRSEDLNLFFSNYRKFVDEALKTNAFVVKYEDFCLDPVKIMFETCSFCDIPFDKDFINKYFLFQNVNGDVQRDKNSRNLNEPSISLAERKLLKFKIIRELNSNPDMKYCNTRFGYLPNYCDKGRQTGYFQLLKRKLKKWLW